MTGPAADETAIVINGEETCCCARLLASFWSGESRTALRKKAGLREEGAERARGRTGWAIHLPTIGQTFGPKTSRLYGNIVEALGIEPPATYVPIVAKRREDDADRATQDDAKRREVSASTPMSADEAIRVAAKLAIRRSSLVVCLR